MPVTATIRAQLINIAARITHRPPQHPATTHQLAAGQRVSEAHHRRHRTTDPNLTSPPTPHAGLRNSPTNRTRRSVSHATDQKTR
jgi:hypothetical protein